MHEHEERAEAATVVAVIGGCSASRLGHRREEGQRAIALTGAALVGAIGTAGLMGWTGQAGGQIRHDEIRDGAPAGATGAAGAGEAGEEEDDD
ncbi:MAG: hypothetical protein IPL39_25535 [Opitutaceae bacterium]|nr:hypothetical protein [Opitutaceae bacterium]